jgi:hypothetical protein
MGTGSAAGGTGGLPDSRGRQGAVSFACLWILLACCTIRQQPPVQTDFEGYARFVTTSECLFSHLLTSIGGAAVGDRNPLLERPRRLTMGCTGKYQPRRRRK